MAKLSTTTRIQPEASKSQAAVADSSGTFMNEEKKTKV